MRNFVFLLFLLCFNNICFAQHAKQYNEISSPAKIHVILYIDEFTSIARSCQLDEQILRKDLKKISNITKTPIEFYKGDFLNGNVNKLLSEIKTKKDDVLIFYYSGHGFRYRNQVDSSKYPYLAFLVSSREELDNSTMFNLEEIHKVLIRKNARLTITIGDLCNSKIPISLPTTAGLSGEEVNYNRLFKKAKGDIIASSSIVGQPSIATNEGSIFTRAFSHALENETKYNGADLSNWDNLFKETVVRTKKISEGQQIPFSSINVTYDNIQNVPASLFNN